MTSNSKLVDDARALVQEEVSDAAKVEVAGLASLGRNPFPFWFPTKPNAVGMSAEKLIFVPIAFTRPLRRRQNGEVLFYPTHGWIMIRDRSNFAYDVLVMRSADKQLDLTIPKHSLALADALRSLVPSAGS
jgi:hypothetical protein